MKKLFVTLVVGSLLLIGCATQGKSTMGYTPRAPISVANEIVVNQPYSQVWDKLVKELSKSYYVINNIDKESRIINLSFSGNKPQEFIDCGRTSRTYTQGDKVETFNYDVASSSVYKGPTARQPHPAFYYYYIAKRTTNLEGRSNIYLAPDESDKTKTRVAINTRYVLTITVRADAFQENMMGAIISSAPMSMDAPTTIAFNTNKPMQPDNGSNGAPSITCSGNGKLETEILGLLQN